MIAMPAVVGIGGNVGDVAATIRAALGALDATDGIRVVAVSSLYRTAPVGGVDHKGHEVGIEGVVIAEGQVLEVLDDRTAHRHVIAQGMFSVATHADLPSRRYAFQTGPCPRTL